METDGCVCLYVYVRVGSSDMSNGAVSYTTQHRIHVYCILHTIHILYVHNTGNRTGRNILDPENAHALLLWLGSKVKRCQVSVCKE